jgi:hypothetical protein
MSKQQLSALRTLIQSAANKPGEDVAARIANDVPAASGLLPLLLSNGGIPMATWLALIVTIINLLVMQMDAAGHQALSDTQIEQIIEHALTPNAAPIPSPAVPAPTVSPRVGRNQPCPCGSGKKYKYCHLGNDERR